MAVAQIAATFVGFGGVVFAVDRSSAGGVSTAERNAIMNLLVPSIAVLFLAFGPLVASAGGAPDVALWRTSNAVLAAVHLVLLSGALRAAVRGQLLEPIPLRFVLFGGGFLAVAANVAVALGFIADLAPMAFLAGLVWFLFEAGIQFVMLIVLHVRAT